MAEKRKMFRKKRFKRFEDSVEKCLENDSRLQSVVSDVTLRERLWRRFVDTDDSDDTTDDNDFLGFDANAQRIQELLQRQWAKRIATLASKSTTRTTTATTRTTTTTTTPKTTILRKARLEISSKTLQRIRSAHQRPEPSRSGQPGFITCAICQTTKYYSHVQRRYGVFSCEPCSKFFARFLKDPHQLFCSRDGNCPMDGASGQRCRACWLTACLKTFQMESRLREDISSRFSPKVSSMSSPLSVVTNDTNDANNGRKKSALRGQPLLMVAQSGPRVKRVCRRTVTGLPVATFGPPLEDSDDSDELPVDVYLCRAVAAQRVTS